MDDRQNSCVTMNQLARHQSPPPLPTMTAISVSVPLAVLNPHSPHFNRCFQITASVRLTALLIRAEMPHGASLGNHSFRGSQAAEDNLHLS